jgi:hypothetical protein
MSELVGIRTGSGPGLNCRRWRFSNYGNLAEAVAKAVRKEDSKWAWRLFGEAIDDSRIATDQELLEIIEVRPEPTGVGVADAGVAAMAEWLCVKRGLKAPNWSQEVWRVASPFWFATPHLKLQQLAFIEAPISFSRRGIFITQGGLLRA